MRIFFNKISGEDMSKEKAGQSKIHDDDCILIVDSSSDEEFEPCVAGMSTQNRNMDYVVIDSDSDDEYFPEEDGNEILEVLSDTDDFMIQEFPIIISDDDDSNVEGPVTTEEDAADEGQMASIEKEMEQCALSLCNSSDDTGENLCQPPNAAEVEVEISDIKMSTDGEFVPVPRKRKCKTKNICVTPAVRGQKRVQPSKKKCRAARPKKCEPRNTNCNIPGCFLRNIEKLKQYSGRKFKKNKDELVQKLYTLMNNTVFENKLPERLDICWNNKMLRTAGLCSSGLFHCPRERYTKIEISLKVCDSADRIRDTLIHELCHAASWLLDGIRDSHGHAWRYYARKCNKVHPELPLVTRCHNYKINYKIYYECAQCKTRVGRYTRSLDVVRFVCAECKGPLVLLPLTRKDGTPIKPHVRPFAKYVKLHYRLVREQTEGITHGDVMRTLSKDYFICKEKNKL
ncbi:PREDICTED: acidic repeat-containing protein isoform X2 [Myotis brandtii]|uniref:acidic repeat-containing protein isoform X2 n=1 Tax=Myotis brandtii TaxID=109478 RepID=UPI000703FB30|nr:PREDICTED: acidic repeat-containing protein isoform X2 [Myotis brandtii]